MQTKIEFILTGDEARQRVAGYNTEADAALVHQNLSLVTKLIEELGLDGQRGGWVLKTARTKDGGVKVTGKLIPPGGAVLG